MHTICDINGNQFGEGSCQLLKDIFSGLVRKVLQSLMYLTMQTINQLMR
jgi:hypothetical protein